MSGDDRALRAELVEVAPAVDVDDGWVSLLGSLRADARRRRLRRAGVLGAVIVVLGVGLLHGAGGDDAVREVVFLDQPTAPTAPSTPRSSLPSAPPGTPTPVPEGMTSVPEEVVEFYRRQQRTGMKQIDTFNGVAVYVRFADIAPADPTKVPLPGTRFDAVDAEGNVLGAYVVPIGFVPSATVDAPGFDWTTYAAGASTTTR